MKILGLTGPTGAGKTRLSEIFRHKGFPYVNADELYHSMLTPPSQVLDAIRKTFGDKFFDDNGELCRKALGRYVFSSPERLEALNAAVLPLVIEKLTAIAEEYKKMGAALLIIDAPTLFEAGYDRSCDLTVSVLASKELRIERISRRDGISEYDALLRTDAQKDDSFYYERSDFVIINDGDEDMLSLKADELLLRLGIAAEEKP